MFSAKHYQKNTDPTKKTNIGPKKTKGVTGDSHKNDDYDFIKTNFDDEFFEGTFDENRKLEVIVDIKNFHSEQGDCDDTDNQRTTAGIDKLHKKILKNNLDNAYLSNFNLRRDKNLAHSAISEKENSDHRDSPQKNILNKSLTGLSKGETLQSKNLRHSENFQEILLRYSPMAVAQESSKGQKRTEYLSHMRETKNKAKGSGTHNKTFGDATIGSPENNLPSEPQFFGDTPIQDEPMTDLDRNFFEIENACQKNANTDYNASDSLKKKKKSNKAGSSRAGQHNFEPRLNFSLAKDKNLGPLSPLYNNDKILPPHTFSNLHNSNQFLSSNNFKSEISYKDTQRKSEVPNIKVG